jgi:DNA primase
LLEVNTEISPNWRKFYKGKIFSREELYKYEVISSVTYLKLRKIKRLISENEKELEQSTDPETQLLCMKTSIHLKALEKELTQLAGTVIYK